MFTLLRIMGCLFTKSSRHQTQDQRTEPPKQYSWDVRKKVDPKDFTLENLSNETVYRLPGSINGQQFIIQNCQHCSIFLLDHIGTITIDDCSDCRIVVGPVKTSIFVRDCKECKVLVACQQFRSRDCSRMDISLCCTTQPIIESSTAMRFSCFQYSYPELEEQFRLAGLSVFNNNWSHVHDFTPVADEKNFSLLPLDAKLDEYIPVPDPAACSVQVNINALESVVPLTHGKRRSTSNESCFVVLFYDNDVAKRAGVLIRNVVTSQETKCFLVQTKEVQMPPSEIERILAVSGYADACKRGFVIGMEFSGDEVCRVCQNAVRLTVRDCPGVVYISPDTTTAAQQIDRFYNTADMMLQAI